MANGKHPIIAKEGWIDIAVLAIAAGTTQYFASPYWAIPLWVLLVFVTQFFRDPHRKIPADPLAVICPADGRVIKVAKTQDPYLGREAICISVFMNVFNVHSNRSPTEGAVKERWYHKGRFFNASLDKASSENERNALWIQTDEGDDVTVVQIAGLVARRILCYKQPGERIGQGERFGFIRYGSRVDIYVALNSNIHATIGQKVKSGRDILAHLVH